jgi:Zn-dependent peptidase ImmA (M78 family)/transcriptional regulator with XRE-family HTH domain
MSAAELARQIGVSRQTMTNYLKATTAIDSVQLVKIARIFSVSVDTLLTMPNMKQALLFRTALNYSQAVDTVIHQVEEYFEKYKELIRSVGRYTSYLPEQYNLSVFYQGQILDINYECQDYFAPKLEIDDALDREISRIADEQRRLLGLSDQGAISVVSALASRGVHVIFMDLGSPDTFGLSLWDEALGCFIFVNSNDSITVERQLFTVAHEYAHVLLHRPIYRRHLHESYFERKSRSLLDKMADCFAGYFLCPERFVLPFKESFIAVKGDLEGVIRYSVPIKVKYHLSLQTVMKALDNYGYLAKALRSEFYQLLKRTKTDKIEPIAPISENRNLMSQFEYEKTFTVLGLLRLAYDNRLLISPKEEIIYFAHLTHDVADALLESWGNELSGFRSLSIREE